MGNALYSGLIDVSFFAIFVGIDMNKSVYIKTWGCQMNFHQSEGIAGVLVIFESHRSLCQSSYSSRQ